MIDENPMTMQIGGDHYKDFKIAPIEYIYKNNIPWLEANAIKYISRHRGKNGAEDLRKAKHYIDILLKWEYGEE